MLSALLQRWRVVHWGVQLAWLCAALLTVAGVTLAVRQMAELHLRADAERSAAAWGRYLGSSVPDIDLIFLGDLPSPPAQERLTAMRGMAGLAHFRLYGPEGQLLLISDSVGTWPHAEDRQPASERRAREAVAGGPVVAELLRANNPGQPAVLGRAFVPVHHAGQAIGVLEVQLDQSEAAATTATSFGRAAALAGLAMAICLMATAALVCHRARRERRVLDRAQFLAEHDVLTGALNHGSFSRTLEEACSQGSAGEGALAVICIDLDEFGDINDRHGHAAGDELLRRTALRLQALLRGDDLLARLAGDRFAVLQRGPAHGVAVRALVQRIVHNLAEPHDLPGLPQPVQISASAGAALHGIDGVDAPTLLHNAELALLRAKTQGRGSWSFYEASLDRQLQESRALGQDLRQALAQGFLRLHYQPLYAGNGRTLLGYEALARWPHPTRGFVPPAEFIPVAESSGQIEALGRWVLQTACHEAAGWPAPLSVAVNLSAAQFRRGDAVVDEVREALQSSGLEPRRLELEITESLLMSHTEQVLGTLHALRGLGVRIAMDDFGTGYSSLAYLWRFPFDKLKIDRAFTQGLGTDPRVEVIVRSVVRLAHSLSIRVNAEGVETDGQRDALRQLGCDELQGYLLGKPAPAERLPHLELEIVAVVVPEPALACNTA